MGEITPWDPTNLLNYGVGRDGKVVTANADSRTTGAFQTIIDFDQEHGWRLGLLAPEEPAEKRDRQFREELRAGEIRCIVDLPSGVFLACMKYQPMGHKRLGHPAYPKYGAQK